MKFSSDCMYEQKHGSFSERIQEFRAAHESSVAWAMITQNGNNKDAVWFSNYIFESDVRRYKNADYIIYEDNSWHIKYKNYVRRNQRKVSYNQLIQIVGE